MKDLEITRWRVFKWMAWPIVGSVSVAVSLLWSLNTIHPIGPFWIFLGGFWAGGYSTAIALKKGIRKLMEEDIRSYSP